MFSDSLSDSSRGEGQESFSVEQSSEMDKQQLKELNNELAKENALLRAQFEEAIGVTAELENLHAKNQEYTTQIRNLQAEKDDLKNRFEISLATNKELTKKLDEEKRNRSQQNDTNITAMNNEIERIKEQSKAQLDSVLQELETAKSIHEKDVLQQKTIVGRIDRVLQGGERFFQTKFSTIDDLIEFFEHPSSKAGNSGQQADATGQFGKTLVNYDQLEKKMKHLKSKLRSASQDKSELQAELARTQRDAHTLKMNAQQQISELQAQINNLTEDYQMADVQKNQKISALENQVESLKSELSRARTQIDSSVMKGISQSEVQLRHPNTIQDDSKNFKKVSKQDESERIQHLLREVDDLTEKIRLQDKVKNNDDQKLRDAETAAMQQKQQIEKLKTENATLKSLVESSNAEIETLRNALHTKKEPLTLNDIPQPKQPANVVKYQKAIEEQKAKLLALNQQNDKLKKQVEKQEEDITDLNEKLKLAHAATKKVNDDFADYRTKVESKRPLTIDDILPPEAFRCPEFDGVLSSTIQKVAGNPSLQPVSKIQSCFKSIVSHYSNQLQELQKAFEDTMKEHQFLSSSFNKFIVDLSIALSDQPTTIEDFFKGNGGQQLIEKVAEFRVTFDDMKHQNDRLNEVFGFLEESFGTAGQNIDPMQQVANIKNQFTTQLETISQKSSKLKKLRRDLRNLIQSSEAMKTESSQKIEDLTNAVQKLESQLSALEKSTKSLKQENHSLQIDLADATRRANQNEEDFKEREKEVVNKLMAEHQQKLNEVTSKYNSLSAQYTELVDDYNSQSEQLKNYEDAVDNLRKTVTDKDREINDMTKEMKHRDTLFEQKLEDGKADLTRTYQNVIDQLKDQCEKHRLDVEKMAKVLADNEKQFAIIKAENLLFKKDKVKAEQELKSQSDKFDREKKIMESSFTAKKIQYETAINGKLNDERSRFEADKRRICAYAAEAFKMFFDANATIDERSYKNVIDTTKDELTKLLDADGSIRRIVGAREGQTTEDAVAQVIMSQV